MQAPSRCAAGPWPGHAVPPEERGVGILFQDYALFPLTVGNNVGFGLARAARRDRAGDGIDLVGLGGSRLKWRVRLA